MATHVLVVEPDPRMGDRIRALLRGCQIATSALDDASRLLAHVTATPPTLIVMRVERPATTFYMALGALRRAGHDMPVIVISRDAQVLDKVVALEIGADDYLVEPFDPMELIARVRSAMRRYAPNRPVSVRAPVNPESYAFGDIEVNFVTRRATRAGQDLGLRASEFALLALFISQPMRVLSRAEILALLGLSVAGRSERGLDVLIFRLRNLVEQAVGDYRYIRTVRGKGYIFVPLGRLADEADALPHA
ncbi:MULTISPECIES: response regulator transcription factor [Burkholderia]|uniref:Histidine kinase n=1 Tax=Burkholderia cenocepacia TaxID=95486 RepID=A0A071MKB9_9BURK|nr:MULTISPECIES: response regulator transcription factor [Burkholderia]AOJ26539.1 two-component system response regulator [Burkholderia seminalis]KVF43829.1 two-component system response regulator [Burkholderia seminalis]MBJ9592202.1 response regulator transcription factor [Burkholderia seminalis]MBN3739678.1 response regulator transcription factor [Burkholderia sp. Tr-20355]MCA8038556.1 response regulator transcription factor [Burkholderia seminalis]